MSFKGGEITIVAWEKDPRELLNVWGRLWGENGEGNGTPLQCSCLENPRDRGAWWAAVSGVTQSRTRLKRLSSMGEMSF